MTPGGKGGVSTLDSRSVPLRLWMHFVVVLDDNDFGPLTCINEGDRLGAESINQDFASAEADWSRPKDDIRRRCYVGRYGSDSHGLLRVISHI